MFFKTAKVILGRSLALLLLAALPAAADVFSTTPGYTNPVRPGVGQASASATLASGSNYAPTNRPTEAGSARFKIDSWTVGMPFSSAPPNFNFGDIITPPPLADPIRAPSVVTANGAFYLAKRRQLVAAQAGTCVVDWPTTTGTTNRITYTIGALPGGPASRLFWTDNYTAGAVNTNATGLPDNNEYAVSLSHIYAKIHYNAVVPDFDSADSQDTAAGQAARSTLAITQLGRPAIWIDGNSLLRARNQSGYLIVEYFDTPSFDNSAGYEIVYVGPARVYQSSVVLGDRLLPSEGADVAAGLIASISKAKDYVVQWSTSGSHFENDIFATAVNSDATQPTGDPSKTQILWQRTGNLGIIWPYEPHWYAITWAGDESAHLFVYDPTNPAGSPPINIPTNYTASIVWSEKSGTVAKADSTTSTIQPVGEGRALIQYQNNLDVWFVPVRLAARTNGAYVSNQEVFWPVGTPLQPVANSPRLQFDGVGNYLSFSSDLQPGFTTELWIRPATVTNNQTLAAFLDYPQQATVQAALTLAGSQLRLDVFTGPVTNDVLIADASFESAKADSTRYATNVPGWAIGGGVSVNANGAGPFADNGQSQNGTNVVGLQNGAAISQTVAGLVPGQTYTLSFSYNARSGTPPHLRVQADAATLFDQSFTAVGGTAAYNVASVNFTNVSSSFLLTFTEYNTNSADCTALVDGIRIFRTSSVVELTSTNSIPAGVWSHVAFTKSSSGQLKLYVNGILDGTATVTTFNGISPQTATYAEVGVGQGLPINGAAQTTLAPFAGEIREVRLWSAQLDGTTIQQNMSAALRGDEPNLDHLITPLWQQTSTPLDPDGEAGYQVLDLATGENVLGYGTPNTAGQLPYTLNQRLALAGNANNTEIPLTWKRSDAQSVEFWLRVGDGNRKFPKGDVPLLEAKSGTNSTVELGLSGGRLDLLTNGVVAGISGTVLEENSTHHIALVAESGQLRLYLDGNKDGVVVLPGRGSDVLATRLVLEAGTATNSTLNAEFSDFRIYATTHSTAQVNADLTSAADFTDSTLVRWYDFSQVTPSNVAGEAVLLVPDAARGVAATYHGPAVLGSTINLLPPAEVTGGIIRSGTAYHPGIYAAESRIIPVNDTPTNSLIEVWWSSSFTAPYLDQPLGIPGIVTRYRLMDPIAAPVLAVAGQKTAAFNLPTTWAEPSVYYQNDVTAVGYNPNEEHALIFGPAAYALRWDLNQPATSPAYMLLQYKDTTRGLLSYLQPVQVIPTNSIHPNFDGSLLVGQELQSPTPIIYLLPYSPLSGPGADDPLHRLFQDRTGTYWAQSASSTTPDSVPMRWQYPLEPGFYWPSSLGTKNPGDSVPFGNTSNGLTIHYTINWPTNLPTLALGQTLSTAIGGLPAIYGQKSAAILFDEANYSGKTSAYIVDPTTVSSSDLASTNGIATATDIELGQVYFTLLPPHLRDRVTWDPTARKLNLSGAVVQPITGDSYVLPAWLGSPSDPNSDYSIMAGLSPDPNWQAAVAGLRQPANVIPNAEVPFSSIVLTPSGFGGGHVTLGFNTRTNFNLTGDPVSVVPFFLDTTKLYTGSVIVLYSDNKFDQYTTLRHNGDFGGDPSQYEFEWRYSPSNFGQVPASPNANLAAWLPYGVTTRGLSRIVFGGPGLLTLEDVYFSVHWRCVASGAPNTNWSSWTEPALVENWLTRALDGINPFDQRVGSLANNQLDLTTSILSQAGKRYVGAVPLNMDNADSFGLIEIYETLLQQARNLSIDAGYKDDNVNASLLDAASKLNELYTMLGDEALSDAKDPTIAWGTRDLNDIYFGSRASSLFAFQGIVPTLLEEELALLRGLDDTSSTPVTTYPVYNRLYWNFTKGINSGEPAYALNYNIPSVTTNSEGSITEADAARLYPQGHGDAYGHYLTALMDYYRLLENTNFTWYPRAEVKTIGGVNVSFDYVDERKMAASALQLARTSVEIVDRTFRRDYQLDPSKRVPLYVDSNTNRAWSATEWVDRSSQGALYNWIVLNSLLPAPIDGGGSVTNITRATVPELSQLAGLIGTLQDKQDDIDRGDSPMGVAANVVPFDLDPLLADAGKSHFEQIYDRAVTAMQAAYTVLQRASEAGTDLRRQDVSLESFRYQIAQRENEFNAQLVDLYGTPYPDDIGPTGSFVTGYQGPDLYHYNYIDRDLFSPADAGSVTNVTFNSKYSITGDNLDTLTAVGANVTYSINSDGIPVLPDSWTGGQRAIYGKIEGALGDYIRAWITLRSAIAHQQDDKTQLTARLQRLQDHNSYSASYGAIDSNLQNQQFTVNLVQEGLDLSLSTLDTLDSEVQSAYEASKDPLPQSFIAGLADGGDLSFPARIGLAITKLVGEESIGAAKDAANFASYAAGKLSSQLDNEIAANADALAGAEDQSQTVMETTQLLSKVNADSDTVYGAAVSLRQAWQNYLTLVSKGIQVQEDLLAFRQDNAARIQEARYADVIFRTFKNEDLEEYLNAFQQASRYVFATARVYDYETGLLDPTVVSGQSGDFMGDTMKATQLGDMVDGQPVGGSSDAGDLASILAKMNANWAVLKGRFGINNPTREKHRISLRQELFRIGKSADPIVETNNLGIWQNRLYTYRVADIRQVPEFKNFCQYYSPMGTNEPALVIPFSTQIQSGFNVFGLPLVGGDTVFDSAHFTTKLRGSAVSFAGYNQNVGSLLTKSPRVYLVPAGVDRQRTPIDGGATIRDWQVIDQVWPIPYPSAAGNVSFPLESIGTDNVHVIRRFPPMRAYDDDELTAAGSVPYDSRLIARSVWNTEWVLIIPGSSLSSSPSTALDSLIEGISDIYLLLDTYSYSGN